MKQLDYGKNYKYAHNHAGGVADQQHLPDQLAGRKFYQPTDRGYEKLIGERMTYLAELKQTTREQT